jgi:hypothetical protein
VSYKSQEQLTFREYMGSHSVVGGVRVAHIISFLCCVCLGPDSCVPNVASFSGLSNIDCPFGFL